MRSGRPAKNWPGRWASCSKRASIRARDMSRWIYTLAHMCKCGGSMIVNPQIKLVGAVELSWPMERRCLRQEGSSFRLSSEKSGKERKPKATRIIVLLHQFNFGIYIRLSDAADINAQKSDRVREKRLLGLSLITCFAPYMTANFCIESDGQVCDRLGEMMEGVDESCKELATVSSQ